MSVNIMEGQWQQLRGKIREKWNKLTDDDLDQLTGGTDQLVSLLQAKYGYARDRAQHEVDAFLKATKAR
jgi:uncharacterized protein YjbJ (UPF0337 family)